MSIRFTTSFRAELNRCVYVFNVSSIFVCPKYFATYHSYISSVINMQMCTRVSEIMDPNLRYISQFTIPIFSWCYSITYNRKSITNNKVIIIEFMLFRYLILSILRSFKRTLLSGRVLMLLLVFEVENWNSLIEPPRSVICFLTDKILLTKSTFLQVNPLSSPFLNPQ